jgi:sulfite exporter TauE/SafE
VNALPLLGAALLAGLAGAPHCAAMCGAPCAAAARACGSGAGTSVALQAGRVAGYATAGGLIGAGAAALHASSGWASALHPIWTLAQAAALAFGLWMLASGRLPAWSWSTGRTTATPRLGPGEHVLMGPSRAAAVGSAWILLPCGLSQAALLLAALTDGPVLGAAVMTTFALASMPGLLLLPFAWRGLLRRHQRSTWPARIGGASLAATAAWALGHAMWMRAAAWCAT